MLVVICCTPLAAPTQTWPAPYRHSTLWGYVHPETGQIIVPPTLESVSFFQSYDVSFPLAWVKKGGRYGLVNRLGELVLPIEEPASLSITSVAKGYFAVERFALGAPSAEAEANWSESSQEFILRPIAFFDENGRAVGKPFAFQTNSYLGEGGHWEDPNGFDTDMDSSYWLGQPMQEMLILNNLSITEYPHGGTIPFASDDRLGYLLPDDRIKWVGKSDFVLDNHRGREARYVLKGFDCPVESLLNPTTGEWIVAPKMCQTIAAYDELAAFAFVYDEKIYSPQKTILSRIGLKFAAYISSSPPLLL